MRNENTIQHLDVSENTTFARASNEVGTAIRKYNGYIHIPKLYLKYSLKKEVEEKYTN
jgi:hypothetical protein